MRSSIQFLALFAAIMVAPHGTAVANSELSVADISKIEAVCRSLLGVEDWRAREIFTRRLMPYISSKKALAESSQLDCSFHCGGTLLSRGGADIWYGFSNQPIGVTHRIDTVALHVPGKRVFAVGPGLDYYPYPYYDAEHKKR